MNKWEELRKWVFHRQDLVTQNKMRELEAATHRKIMDGTTGLYWTGKGTLEWAVREAMKQNVVYNTNDGLHRVLAETIYSGLLCIREGINLTLIPKSGWYAEKKPLKSISELW